MYENALFSSADSLIAYLKSSFPDKFPLSPIKLQKILYFMFAFYGATMGKSINSEELSEDDEQYPKYLFDEEFVAWKYGPVIRSVYDRNKRGEYDKELLVDVDDIPLEALEYLEDLFIQLYEIADFSLVQRSHMDKEWKDKVNNKNPFFNNVMDNDNIIAEYEAR